MSQIKSHQYGCRVTIAFRLNRCFGLAGNHKENEDEHKVTIAFRLNRCFGHLLYRACLEAKEKGHNRLSAESLLWTRACLEAKAAEVKAKSQSPFG